MHDSLDWSHNEAYHLGVLSKEFSLDCVISDDGCFEVNGYRIATDSQLADFVSALKIISNRGVFMGDING